MVKTLRSHTLGHDSDLIDLECGLVFRIFFKLFKRFDNSPDAAKILNHGPTSKQSGRRNSINDLLNESVNG